MKTNYLAAIFIISTSLFAQDFKLSLKDAIQLSLQKNERIKQYEQKVIQRENENLAAYGNFLPNLNFEASYTHLNGDMTIDLNPIRDVIISMQSSNQVELANLYNIATGKGALVQAQKDAVKLQAADKLNSLIPQFTETFKKQDYKMGTFVATQPIFLGGKLLAAKNAAEAEKEVSLIELDKARNEIVFEVIDRYTKVLLLNEIVSTREAVLNGMLKHKEDANKLYKEGLIANHHLLRAEVAVSEAERNLINDKNNLDLANRALKSSLGISEDNSLAIVDSLNYKPFSDSLITFKSISHSNQPILKIIEQKKILAEENYNVARSSFLPTVAAFGKFEIYPEYLSSLEPRWAVGIQMKYNLFNGFKDYLRLESAKHLENEVEFLQTDAIKKIDLLITKSYLEVINNKTRFEKLKATTALAEENLRQNEKRFKTGLGTSLEVIDARLSLEKVEVDKYLTLYQYFNALNNLYLNAGNTIELLKIWQN